MSINSRQKGAAGERELSKVLREAGYIECRRGQQYCGANGDADVVGLEDIHIECKRVEKLNIDDALTQALNDKKQNEYAMVFHRKNHTKWKVTMTLEDFLLFYKCYRCVKNFEPEVLKSWKK